ncbi:TauD/TfdA family dioxygenase [Micromonospora phytophila]|nr:TauD/TfdA family dioxygenase [Micromonospora phytophila]
MWSLDGVHAEPRTVAAWMQRHRAEIADALHRSGALLIRGFPRVTAAEKYESVIAAAFPQLRDYVGGTSPRTRLHGRIMTATETPPAWSIPLHQEMAYTSNGPHRVAFLCLTPATRGGLSLLGDMAAALESIPRDCRDEFERRGLRLRRSLPSRSSMVSKAGIQKTWQEVFDTDDSRQVDDISRRRGWHATWLDDDWLQLTQERMPAVRRHPVTDRLVWHNQAHFFAPACMIEWAARDGRTQDEKELREALATRPESLDNVLFGDGAPVPPEQAVAIARSLATLEVGVRLEKGDLLLIDNILTAHGRSSFEGPRRILVALADEPGWTVA